MKKIKTKFPTKNVISYSQNLNIKCSMSVADKQRRQCIKCRLRGNRLHQKCHKDLQLLFSTFFFQRYLSKWMNEVILKSVNNVPYNVLSVCQSVSLYFSPSSLQPSLSHTHTYAHTHTNILYPPIYLSFPSSPPLSLSLLLINCIWFCIETLEIRKVKLSTEPSVSWMQELKYRPAYIK